VADDEGGEGEFLVTGNGRLVEDAETRALAVELASYNPADRYILFELSVDSALGFIYKQNDKVRLHWKQE
jgi:hypothetical protein